MSLLFEIFYIALNNVARYVRPSSWSTGNTYGNWTHFLLFILFHLCDFLLIFFLFVIRFVFSAKRKYFKKLFFFFQGLTTTTLCISMASMEHETQLNRIYADSVVLESYVSFLKWKFYFLRTKIHKCSPLLRTTSTRHKRNMNIFALFGNHNDIMFGIDFFIWHMDVHINK